MHSNKKIKKEKYGGKCKEHKVNLTLLFNGCEINPSEFWFHKTMNVYCNSFDSFTEFYRSLLVIVLLCVHPLTPVTNIFVLWMSPCQISVLCWSLLNLVTNIVSWWCVIDFKRSPEIFVFKFFLNHC